jgi:hypothetical protein
VLVSDPSIVEALAAREGVELGIELGINSA